MSHIMSDPLWNFSIPNSCLGSHTRETPVSLAHLELTSQGKWLPVLTGSCETGVSRIGVPKQEFEYKENCCIFLRHGRNSPCG